VVRRLRTLSYDDVQKVRAAVAAGEARNSIAAALDISPATVKTIIKNFEGWSDDEIEREVNTWDKYRKIFRALFGEKFSAADKQHVDLPFTTTDLARWQRTLGLEGGNPYDLKYNIKGRGALPAEVQATAPAGKEWRVKPTAKGEYVFSLYGIGEGVFELDDDPISVKIPDALPTIVERYARDDEQALLARIRYNNLVSLFLGLSTYSLQSHWKTAAEDTGSPVEIDEMYVGLDSNGAHYAIPVEAKGRARSERLTADQILSNYWAAADTFPGAEVIPIAAKVVDEFTFAMIRFAVDRDSELVTKVFERHYTLATNPSQEGQERPILSDQDIESNAARSGVLNSDGPDEEVPS